MKATIADVEAAPTTSSSIVITDKVKLAGLALFSAVLIAVFMLIQAQGMWEFVLPRRAVKILAMVLAGASIAASTVIFQSVTNNRILTPSIIGVDSLYVLIQTAIVFFLGSMHPIVLSPSLNFLVAVGVMILFSLIMHRLFFTERKSNIYVLLLMGIIFGTLFQSLSSFLSALIDPNEFLVVQRRMFASFNQVKTELLTLSYAAAAATALYLSRYARFLDVLALGKEHAINLGVDHHRVVRGLLVSVFILISISTALVGPITFLGLIVANVAYEMLSTYRRLPLIGAAILVSIVALVGGQLIVERVFSFSTTLSVIINFIGGIYFLYLLLKERSA